MSNTLNTEALLPCPFCGSGDIEIERNGWFVECNQCFAKTFSRYGENARIASVVSWNTRRAEEKAASEAASHRQFGEAVWKYITDQGSAFCGEEISEDILPLAAEAGLCRRVPYDQELHDCDGCDEGDEIWAWENPSKTEEPQPPAAENT